MRLSRFGLAALSIGVIGLAIAAATLAWPEALQPLLLVAALTGLAGAGLLLLRLTRRMDRLRTEVGETRRDLARRIGAGQDSAVQSTAAAAEAIRALDREQRDRFKRLAGHVGRQARRDYAQLVAWQELRDYLEVPPFMPPLRGWAASPDVLRLLVEAIRDHRPELVVECGSGASSVWLGYALRRAGRGRLVALDHDERYAELTRSLVASHGLSGIVEVRYAPLRDWTAPPAPEAEPESQPWYDIDAVADLSGIGLVFIDGPPGSTAPQARYPAGPVLFPRCAPGAVVVLDDAAREGERAAADRWLAADPDLRRASADSEKGTAILTWQDSARSASDGEAAGGRTDD